MHQPALYPGLAGQTVFITGGGSGIGAAITRAFAGQKAKVAFVDIAAEESRALADDIARETGTAPLFFRADLRDVDALRAAIEETRRLFADIAVLVNNAANDERHAVEAVTPAYWDDRMAINLRPSFFAAQAVLPQMKRRGGGAIVNFGSVSWMIPQGGFPAYATAKAAMHGLTRTLARDLGPFNIRVNCVVPGWVMTERQIKLWLTPEADADRAKAQCLPARVMPEDVADMVLFLASDAALKCTAQNFIVDGGWV
ncbi:MAG TPA: SDR family oxidoreductase [Stellaceae bacterium]|nr:SDR family oxidoreductase [Stellaceae bacterium]